MTPRSVVIWITFALPGRGFAQNVSEVQVAPPTVTVKVGERSGLLATAFDRGGNVIPTVRFTWSSNNVSVAKVDNDGTVTGVAGGVAIVEARVGARRGQAAVQVIGAPAAGTQTSAQPQTTARAADATGVDPFAGQPVGTGPASVMRIEPPTVYLLPSENTRVVPRALKDDGSPAAPVAVTWKSLRPDIASVDLNGVIVALSAGQGTVQVSSSTGLTATAPVVVQASDIAIQELSPVTLGPNEVDTLHVVVPGQGGRIVSPLTMQWASADPNVARVSLTGVVTAVAPGKTALSVSGLLQTKSLDIVVRPDSGNGAVRGTRARCGRPARARSAAAVERRGHHARKLRPRYGRVDGKKGRQDTARGQRSRAGARLHVGDSRHRGRPQTVRHATRSAAQPALWPARQLRRRDGSGDRRGDRRHLRLRQPAGRHCGGGRDDHGGRRANLAQLRKVLDDSATAAEPAYSPDGSRLAFVSTRDGQPEIYVMDADGTNPSRLTNAPGADGDPSFTADGRAVLFHSPRTGHRQIFLQPITSSDAIQLTQEPSDNSQPSPSPDGETIAFVSNRDGSDDIWLMSRDGSNQRNFTKSPQVKEKSPHFMRDGSLAFLLEGKDGGRTVTQVVKADLASGRVAQLTGTDLVITDFAVSPGGDLLALVVNVQKNLQKVFVQPVGTGGAGAGGGGGGAPVAIPTTGAEQMVSATFMP